MSENITHQFTAYQYLLTTVVSKRKRFLKTFKKGAVNFQQKKVKCFSKNDRKLYTVRVRKHKIKSVLP